VPAFIVAQLVGGLGATAAIRWWYPGGEQFADAVIVPHIETEATR
jgi:glycerol uptake facilitator-like aquaporin